jgi:hypothetical protein
VGRRCQRRRRGATLWTEIALSDPLDPCSGRVTPRISKEIPERPSFSASREFSLKFPPYLLSFATRLRNFSLPSSGWVAQLAEQRTENPRVGGSIPSPATTFKSSQSRANTSSAPVAFSPLSHYRGFPHEFEDQETAFQIRGTCFPNRHIGLKPALQAERIPFSRQPSIIGPETSFSALRK